MHRDNNHMDVVSLGISQNTSFICIYNDQLNIILSDTIASSFCKLYMYMLYPFSSYL